MKDQRISLNLNVSSKVSHRDLYLKLVFFATAAVAVFIHSHLLLFFFLIIILSKKNTSISLLL